jgi:MFS family permease
VLYALSLRQPVAAPLLGLAGLALATSSLRAVLPGRVPAPGSRHLPSMTVAALAHLSFFGAEAFLPLALTVLHHRSLTEAGAALTVAAFTWTGGTWLQAHTQDTLGPRVLSAAGLALVALGVSGVAALDWSATPWWLVFVAWAVAGAGMGLTYPTTSLVVVSAAGPGRQGGPVAAMQVLVTLGVAIGTGVGGAALAWSVALGHGRAPGLRIFDVALVAAALVGLGLTVAMPRRVPGAAPALAPGGAPAVEAPPGTSLGSLG